jgi:hypothetical protein
MESPNLGDLEWLRGDDEVGSEEIYSLPTSFYQCDLEDGGWTLDTTRVAHLNRKMPSNGKMCEASRKSL